MPIGLFIKAESSEEIAVSVMAEIIPVKNDAKKRWIRKRAVPLSYGTKAQRQNDT